MAEPTNAEILKEISELKSALLEKTTKIDKEYPQDKGDPEKRYFDVSAFKAALVDQDPKLVTDADLPVDFAGRFKSMYDELTKAKKTEWLESMGLDGFAAALEKYYEESSWWPAYLAAAIAGLLVPIFAGILLANFRVIQRAIQAAVSRRVTGRERILAVSDSGRGIRPQDPNAVTAREGGDAGLASLAHPPAASTLQPLRDALRDVNRRIINFNKAVKKFPSARSLTRTAAGVDKVTAAVAAADPDKAAALAKSLGKLTGAVKHHDPKKVPDPRKIESLNRAMASADPAAIREMATATGKLASAQRHFDPKKLPKARGLASAARSAERLADAGRDAAQAFNTLKIKIQEAAQATA